MFSPENEPYFKLAKVFFAKFVPKIAKRESFCQKLRGFLAFLRKIFQINISDILTIAPVIIYCIIL